MLFDSPLNGSKQTPVFETGDASAFSIAEVERYTEGSHTLYHHRYHLVWFTKYRYRVLRGELQRVWTITFASS